MEQIPNLDFEFVLDSNAVVIFELVTLLDDKGAGIFFESFYYKGQSKWN
jgi:hypothetical protein